MIKAIETSYKGYQFRSRLEARWAVFFDHLGIKWQYEPEGFEKSIEWYEKLGGEPQKVRYLPDFYLPATGTWVEVKGVWTHSDACDTVAILDWGSPLWHFNESFYEMPYEKRREAGLEFGSDCRGLLLLGDVPEINYGVCYHPLISHGKGLRREWVEFRGGTPGPRKVVSNAADLARCIVGRKASDEYLDAVASSADEAVAFLDTKPLVVECKLANPKLMAAYIAAKSARFEFGQSGAKA